MLEELAETLRVDVENQALTLDLLDEFYDVCPMALAGCWSRALSLTVSAISVVGLVPGLLVGPFTGDVSSIVRSVTSGPLLGVNSGLFGLRRHHSMNFGNSVSLAWRVHFPDVVWQGCCGLCIFGGLFWPA